MKRLSGIDVNFQEAVRNHQQGDFARAAVLYRKVVARAPAHADALHLLGLLEAQAGKFELAADLLARSVRIHPQNAEAWNNYGNALLGMRRFADALDAYDRAIALQADYPGAYLNRGNALRDLGRPEQALASYDRALALDPQSADALCNRGNALRDLRRLQEAVESYDRALARDPDHADALCNRGAARKDLTQFEEAILDFEHALALQPDHLTTLNNLGDLLSDLGRYGAAAGIFARLQKAAPEYDYAAGYALFARLRACLWDDYGQQVRHLADDVRKGRRATVPFSFLAVSDSPRDQLQCARAHVAEKFPVLPQPLWSGERYKHDRIRVAYLSADFYDHATARLAAGLFEMHDRRRFEVTAVSFGPDRPDAMHARLRAAFDRFADVSAQSDREISMLLRGLEIDIAVDLKGYTQDARPAILASRPASAQVSYLGFPGTLGADFIDYVIADKHVVPPADAVHYTEKVVYLPDSYQVNDAKRAIASGVPKRSDAGLPEQGFVFCCFNNNFKIAPPVFDVWMRLLRDVPGSVLWLFEDSAEAAANLRREAERRDISAQRLVFAGRVAPADHLARHALADLFLDTLPYNAHTTASDALWAGLPLLTCAGPTFAGRVAASLLHAIGLPEMIAADLAAYEARARRLAGTTGELAELRAKLSRNRRTHPLFDTARFARHMESAFHSIWERSQRSEPPAGFDVQPVLLDKAS